MEQESNAENVQPLLLNSSTNLQIRKGFFSIRGGLASTRLIGRAFLWHPINHVLSSSTWLISRFLPMRDQKLKPTIFEKIISVFHTRRELRSFIRHCRHRAPQPVPFSNSNEPIDVSIIIPVYNQWKYTRVCINSILETCDDRVRYELILADDCSTDETTSAQDDYPGIIIVKTSKNAGFLKNCNHAAQIARGRYILLLNNDTVVLPNWLYSLYDTIQSDATAVIVGSKMLYPSGTIQEAGAVLFRNGKAMHLGKGHHRHTPLFNLSRETDYVSGCSVLICKKFWNSAGGFDERYNNAYFEDVDLAMAARLVGKRVIYQPASEVIHFEHKTYSRNIKKNHEILANKNRGHFLEKWDIALKNHPDFPRPWHIAMSHSERMPSQKMKTRRASKKLNILFYSNAPTYPLNHGNRARMNELAKTFQEMGHSIHFALLDSFECNDNTLLHMKASFKSVDVIPCKKLLCGIGWVPFDNWYMKGIGENIRCLCDQYEIDLVLCSYVFQSKLLEYVPQHILKVIDTHDVMADRYKMLRRNGLSLFQFSCTQQEEGAYLRRADVVIGITEAETEYFDRITDQTNALTISHVVEPKFLKKKFTLVQHVGIVASSNSFNLSMVRQCLESINRYLNDTMECPFLIHLAGDIKKVVDGHVFKRKMAVFKKPWVHMHGFVENLSEFYSQMDLIISPMMCGTGINIKTVEAMAYGMPLLTTHHGSRGIETHDSMHEHENIDALIHSLFTLNDHPDELERLAALSRKRSLQFHEQNQEGLKNMFKHPKIHNHSNGINI